MGHRFKKKKNHINGGKGGQGNKLGDKQVGTGDKGRKQKEATVRKS